MIKFSKLILSINSLGVAGLLLVTSFLPANQTQAQGACPAEIPFPDPCLVGNWIGQNTVAEKMNEILQSMPSNGATINTFPPMTALLGMTIWDDGFYATLPLHQALTYEAVQNDDTVVVDMDLTIGTNTGYIWGDGGRMYFCEGGAQAGNLRTEATSSDGSRVANTPLFGGGGGFTPDITYSCDEGFLDFTVMLPAPIGEIDYNLGRVPAGRFDIEFGERIGRTLP